MRVLVTGVTGFVGGRVAEALAAAGHRVLGLVRSSSTWSDRPDGAETVVGDVTDAATVLRAASGAEAVVHAAALVRVWVRDGREYDRVNVEGLAHVAAAARATGARLVYVSSFIALGPTDGRIFDEETPRATQVFHNAYERSKWSADQLARELALIRVYPGVVYGPGALTQGNHVVDLLLQHARGDLPGLLGSGGTRQCFTYVDDLTRGVVAALDRAAPGSGYILGGDNRTVRDLFDAFQEASGIPPPRRHIPFFVAGLLGKLERWRAELFGTEPRLTDEVVGIYRHDWAYSSARAAADLGYTITPLERGIAETVAWLRRIGRL